MFYVQTLPTICRRDAHGVKRRTQDSAIIKFDDLAILLVIREGEVVAQRRQLDNTDGKDVTLVGNEAGPGLQAQQAQCTVLASRQQHLLVHIEAHCVHWPDHTAVRN